MADRTWVPRPARVSMEEPLRTQARTAWSVVLGDDLAAEDLAEVWGVMAVAASQFMGPEDAWIAFGTNFLPSRTAGPHRFTVAASPAVIELVQSATFRDLVERAAYLRGWQIVDQGALSRAIRDGELWPLPNVVLMVEAGVAHG